MSENQGCFGTGVNHKTPPVASYLFGRKMRKIYCKKHIVFSVF
jgi:hypothetical protein